MKIEIKVTATEVTEDDLRVRKTFATCIDDGTNRYMRRGEMFAVEQQILEAFFMRIRADKDDLIQWEQMPGAVFAKISIIPAHDYKPE